jgi:hypothetical protein
LQVDGVGRVCENPRSGRQKVGKLPTKQKKLNADFEKFVILVTLNA